MFKPHYHINWFNFSKSSAVENIAFASGANFQLSAGFGPNQVSTVLGLPLVIVALSKVFNLKLYSIQIFDYLFVVISTGLAILTFARGGVITQYAYLLFYSLYRVE